MSLFKYLLPREVGKLRLLLLLGLQGSDVIYVIRILRV